MERYQARLVLERVISDFDYEEGIIPIVIERMIYEILNHSGYQAMRDECDRRQHELQIRIDTSREMRFCGTQITITVLDAGDPMPHAPQLIYGGRRYRSFSFQ